MNKQSMYKSIMHLYGLDEDESIDYLTKYVKIIFQIPQIIINDLTLQSESCPTRYFFKLLEKDGKLLWFRSESLKKFISNLIDEKDLQLRDIERLFRSIKFLQSPAQKARENVKNEYVDYLIFLIAYMHVFDHNTIALMRFKQTNTNKIMNIFGMEADSSLRNPKEEPDYIKYIRFTLNHFFAKTESEKTRIQESLANPDLRKQILLGDDIINTCLDYLVFMK